MEDYNDIKFLKEKVEAKEYIEINFFSIFNKIKDSHIINPLFFHILKLGLDQYNNISKCSYINMVGFGNFPGYTYNEKKRNNIYYESDDAYVFYVSYNEDLVNNFYYNRQLLPDLLELNKYENITENETELNEIKLDNLSNISIKSESFASYEDEKVKKQFYHNKAYLKLVSGHTFEINCLTFLLNGIKKIKYLPKVVFYPIIKEIDMEEIDSSFIVEELIVNAKEYFMNFKSIDFGLNSSLRRKEINLNKKDLVFV